MTCNQKTTSDLEKLVEQVKQEMIEEGLYYTKGYSQENPVILDREPFKTSRERKKPDHLNGREIKPEFPGLLTNLCNKNHMNRARVEYKPKEENPIQFRGTPGKKSKSPVLIKGRGSASFAYFGDGDNE